MVMSDLLTLIDELTSRGGDTLKHSMKQYKNYSSKSRNSIRNKTKDLILQYPVLASNSISSDAIQITSRALEHDYVNLLSVLINQKIFEEVDKDEAEVDVFLRKYHTNIYRGAYSETTKVDMQKANNELLTPFSETINLQNLNNLSFPNSILTEAEATTQDKIKEREDKLKEREGKIKEKETELRNRKPGNAEISKMDFKKLNDMTPTMVKLSLKVKSGENIFDKPITFGVKAVIHPLFSDDVIYYLSDILRDNSKFFRLIQWTTGEIKFFRDLVASLDTMKKTAITSTKKDTFWWRKLQSMAKNTFIRKLINKTEGEPVPTATMVISKQDCDVIKNRYGIDILNSPKYVMTIMKKFFLLGFVVIDESTNMVYLFNDVARDYDYYTLNALKSFGKDETDMDVAKSLMKGR